MEHEPEALVMSVADDFSTNPLYKNGLATPTPLTPETGSDKVINGSEATADKPLHRIADVRRQQGVSVRSASRRMGVPPEQVRREEAASADITLSSLHRWQKALEVPVGELLVEQNAPLSGPVLNRARMLRIMKTVRAISESTQEAGVSRMVAMLESQLLEIMPELAEVGAWHSVGQRRTQDEMGRVAEQPVSDNFARDALR